MSIRIEGLSKAFGETRALDGVSLEIPAGQMVGVIGRSGAGKSTLLRLLNRLIDPTEGRIDSGDIEVTALRGAALLAWRAETAMIFQQFNLVDRLDVLTNALIGAVHRKSLPAMLLKRFSAEDRAEAILALDRVELLPFALRRADTLSGGQQQRVAIARALMQRPRFLLADEPIASLDPRSAQRVMETLRRINREDGITVICNLHHLDAARNWCDRIVGLFAGKVVFDGPPAALTPGAVQAIYGTTDPIEAEEDMAEVVPLRRRAVG